MSSNFSLTGVDALVGKLKRNANLNDVKKVVRTNGDELQKKMQRDAPVDTGFLKRSIGASVKDHGFTIVTGPTAEYAPYLIYGTRALYPRDFFRPNYFAQRKQFIDDLKRLMK